jgi:hypothetical protein
VRLLAGLDSLAQLTGDLWQLSPSVFVRSRAVGMPAGETQDAPEAAEFAFRCPACGHAPLPDTPPLITCPACSCTYPVEGGIYDFRIK